MCILILVQHLDDEGHNVTFCANAWKVTKNAWKVTKGAMVVSWENKFGTLYILGHMK